jgi:hypothetical protein
MRAVLGFLIVGLAQLWFGPVLNAQISQAYVPLTLQGESRATQIPPFSTLSMPQCDGSGEVYLSYSSQAGSSANATLVSIDADGSTHTVDLQAAGGPKGDTHMFLFSAASDGSLHEIARVASLSDQNQSASDVEYASYDSDGSLRSESGFDREFIPSLLVPLPDGSFFASGVALKDEQDGVSESALVGIFNSDAKLVRHLQKESGKSPGTASDTDISQETATAFDGGLARLGSDRNVYVLLLGEKAKIAVVNQSGHIVREIQLQEPFETDVAHDMWISGSRILVVYEGEAENSKDAYVYVLYDAQSGEVIRVYRPEFSGTVACFQDGQTLSVLLQEPSSGKISLGTAELQ